MVNLLNINLEVFKILHHMILENKSLKCLKRIKRWGQPKMDLWRYRTNKIKSQSETLLKLPQADKEWKLHKTFLKTKEDQLLKSTICPKDNPLFLKLLTEVQFLQNNSMSLSEVQFLPKSTTTTLSET